MPDLNFVDRLNAILRKPGATIEASRYISPDRVHRIVETFPSLDPYVQGVILQSVIALTPDDFGAIRNEYLELLAVTRESQDDWVRRKAGEFENCPELSIDDDITELDFSGLSDDRPTALLIGEDDQPESRHFSWKEVVRPPSTELPAPRLSQKSGPAVLAKPVTTAAPIPQRLSVFPAVLDSDGKNPAKKKMISLEELQADQDLDFRPRTDRRR
jgi:hypothetical protein